MADRLTAQEFVEALHEQKIGPLVDTTAVRAGNPAMEESDSPCGSSL